MPSPTHAPITNTQAEEVTNLPTRPNNDELLQLYSHYKQATVGDNTTEKPGLFDLAKKAKWNAWNDLNGMSQEEAEAKYIEIASGLIEKYLS